MADSYQSIDEAAAAALKLITEQKFSKDREYMSLIYQDPETGKYLVTPMQSNEDRMHTGGTFDIPRGSLRAIIHNHPGKDRKAGFLSADDLNMATKLGVPSYLVVENELFKWSPKDGKTTGAGARKKGIPLPVQLPSKAPVQEMLNAPFAKALEESAPPSISDMFTGSK